MTFERTRSGQRNRARFLGVELTCYVEGGGGQGEASADAIYWQAIFETFAPSRKIKFLPRGGKPILETLAQQIVADNIDNTFVAMDRDYDGFREGLIRDRRILYSLGYSWENDLFCPDGVVITYGALARLPHVPAAADVFLRDGYLSFERDIRRASAADFFAFCRGSSILPRQSPGRVLSLSAATGFPTCNYREVLKLTADANKSTRARRRLQGARFDNVIANCVGHIVAHAVKLLLTSAVRRFVRNANYSLEHIIDTAVGHLRRHFSRRLRSPKAVYYRGMIDSAFAAI